MAISTFAELKTAVAGWLARTDLASSIPDFVALGESDIRNDVRVQAMETRTTGSLTGETLDHPSRYIAARRLFVNDKKYDYRTPEAYQEARVSGGNSGLRLFTSIGQQLFILNGTDGASYDLVYRAGFTPLSDDTDTNWLLTNAPEVMLFAACKHGALFMKDDQEVARFEGLYAAAVARLNDRESKASVSGSALQMIASVAE